MKVKIQPPVPGGYPNVATYLAHLVYNQEAAGLMCHGMFSHLQNFLIPFQVPWKAGCCANNTVKGAGELHNCI